MALIDRPVEAQSCFSQSVAHTSRPICGQIRHCAIASLCLLLFIFVHCSSPIAAQERRRERNMYGVVNICVSVVFDSWCINNQKSF